MSAATCFAYGLIVPAMALFCFLSSSAGEYSGTADTATADDDDDGSRRHCYRRRLSPQRNGMLVGLSTIHSLTLDNENTSFRSFDTQLQRAYF